MWVGFAAETMISCDVTLKDRSRQSENYDFTFASKYYAEMEGRQGTKRTREDMKNKNFTQKKSEEEFKDKPKEICDLLVNEHSEVQDIVRDIAEKLGEERSDLICKFSRFYSTPVHQVVCSESGGNNGEGKGYKIFQRDSTHRERRWNAYFGQWNTTN